MNTILKYEEIFKNNHDKYKVIKKAKYCLLGFCVSSISLIAFDLFITFN
jgi:hypothetical protein